MSLHSEFPIKHLRERAATMRHMLPLAAWLCAMASLSTAQDQDLAHLASWVALDAPSGHEHLATAALAARYPGWSEDRHGNLVKTVGAGSPHRVVACGLDAYSYAITQITEDGYLRLHRVGNGSRHPLWDQAHEGQQLRILTDAGPVIGVSAIANGHFALQHRGETALITQDDLWLDVGAESASEVAGLGIDLLDPVLRNLPPWYFAGEVAGPRSGMRVGCAAVAAAAESGLNGTQGSTTYILSVQQVFGWVGLSAALSRLPPTATLIVLGPGAEQFRSEAVSGLGGRIDAVLARQVAAVRVLAPAVAARDALMERLPLPAANELLAALVAAVNPQAPLPEWVAAPPRRTELNNVASRWGEAQNLGTLMEIEATLDQVAEKSATPGHEGPVRTLVFNALPDWAREIAQVDEIGNLWLEFGPPGEATVFMAHMDEVGYEVAEIAASGIVSLRRHGGVVQSAWEGQPAVLNLDRGRNSESQSDSAQLRGVFLTRAEALEKSPATVQAWFGMDAGQLEAAGVRVGMGITGYKEGHRMGAYRYAARSLDDRVGTTALLLALQQLDPSRVSGRQIFAWSVQEEGGLHGATALAARVGARSRRIYSIDTFVSSDTPLESPHFSYVPLGSGPVFRTIESAGMVIPAELARNQAIAAAAGLTPTIGLTQGSTDGTAFTFYGAPNAAISWPGRYSHTPAEIADLRDVAGLIDLIQTLAYAPMDTP